MKLSLLFSNYFTFKLRPITFLDPERDCINTTTLTEIFNMIYISLVIMCPSYFITFSLHNLFIQTSPILNSIRKTVVDTCLFPGPPRVLLLSYHHQWEMSDLRYTNHHHERCRIWGTLLPPPLECEEDYRWWL